MYDLNHDGNEDYWDDVFFLEHMEREDHSLDDTDDFDLDDEDDEDDEYVGGYTPTSSSRSSSTSSYNSNNRTTTPVRRSAGVPFILRMIIACVVISVIGAFSELLGFVALIIWVIIEFNVK